MRKLLFFSLILISTITFSQSPQFLNYQGVARDASGTIVTTPIGIKFEILQGSASGTLVYEETNNITPSTAGIFTAGIGGGSPVIGTFPSINWANGPYFIRVGIDPTGGTSYSTVGTSQLLSVPYALYAESTKPSTLSISGNSLSINNGNSIILPAGTSYTGGIGISITGNTITNTAPTPTLIPAGISSITGTYPTFTIDVPPPFLNYNSGTQVLTLTQGAAVSTATITSTSPTISITGPAVIGSYPNYTITAPPATSITPGNSNITVLGAAPNYTVASTPTLNLAGNTLSISNGNSVTLPLATPNTSITGSGIAVVTTVGTNTFDIAVPAATLTGAGATTVSGSYPNFTITSPTIAAAVTPTIIGSGIVVVTPTTGNNFNVAVTSPTFTGVGSTTVSGAYPSYTISTPTPTMALPAWSLLGNAGTVDGTNFIGTTDNIPFNIRVNNQKSGRIDQSLANAFFGYQAGNANTSGYGNTAIGINALTFNNIGNYNTASGMVALYSNTSGSDNTATGQNALNSNTTGNDNTATGMFALKLNSTGNNNTALGSSAGYTNTAGSGNVFLGYNAGYNETGSNKLYIANSSTNPPLIYGDFAAGNVGIGTNSPNMSLHVFSPLPAYIKVESGGATTQNGIIFKNPTREWDLINFVSTSDRISFYDATASQEKFTIDGPTGNVGIGNPSPASRLHVTDLNSKITIDATGAGVSTSSMDLKTASAGTATFLKFNSSGRLTIQSGGAYNMQFLNSIGGSYEFDEGVNQRLYIASGGNVGIGTNSPASLLHVNGQITMIDGNQGLNKVIVSNATGTGSWSFPLNPVKTGNSAGFFTMANSTAYTYSSSATLVITPAVTGVVVFHVDIDYNFNLSTASQAQLGIYVTSSVAAPTTATAFSNGVSAGWATAPTGGGFGDIPVSFSHAMAVTGGTTYYIWVGGKGINFSQPGATIGSPKVIATLHQASGL